MTMMKQILLLAIFAIVLASCRQVTLTCGSCSILCTTGNKCYYLDGQGFFDEICANTSTCVVTASITYQITDCQIGIQGQNCTSGICAAADGVDVCYDDVIAGGPCINYNYIYSCGACSTTPNCQFCAKSQQRQICVDDFTDQCDWSVQTTTGTCPNQTDNLGVNCTCCATSVFVGNSGRCTNLDPILNAYYEDKKKNQEAEERKKQQQMNKNQQDLRTNSEKYITALIAMLLLFMILY